MSELFPEAFDEQIRPIKVDYMPSAEVLEAIRPVSLVAIAGPSGVGKDTLQRELALPRIVSDTIRPPETRDGKLEQTGHEYHFRGGDLDGVLTDVREGRYVQFDTPRPKTFYGSRAAVYPESGPAIIDVVASSLEVVRSLPFEGVHSVFVVAPSMEAWQKRLNGRGDLAERYREAQGSLELALADDRTVFIVNEDGRLDRAAAEIMQVVDNELSLARQERARELGQVMLAGIEAHNAKNLAPIS